MYTYTGIMAIHAVNRRRRRPSRRASALLVVAAVAAASSHASLLAYAASGHAPSGRRGARAGFVQPLVHKVSLCFLLYWIY